MDKDIVIQIRSITSTISKFYSLLSTNVYAIGAIKG